MSLSLWLDAQRSSQLREEQPRCSSRRAVERGAVEQRAQRRDRGAARTRGPQRTHHRSLGCRSSTPNALRQPPIASDAAPNDVERSPNV
eukprot:6667143-Prymnesium_polylepis.1